MAAHPIRVCTAYAQTGPIETGPPGSVPTPPRRHRIGFPPPESALRPIRHRPPSAGPSKAGNAPPPPSDVTTNTPYTPYTLHPTPCTCARRTRAEAPRLAATPWASVMPRRAAGSPISDVLISMSATRKKQPGATDRYRSSPATAQSRPMPEHPYREPPESRAKGNVSASAISRKRISTGSPTASSAPGPSSRAHCIRTPSSKSIIAST